MRGLYRALKVKEANVLRFYRDLSLEARPYARLLHWQTKWQGSVVGPSFHPKISRSL